MTTFEALYKSLPENLVHRGSEFEKLSKWWLQQDPVWSSRFKNVWLWSDWPERNNKDTGIDLVAESVEGDFWAIQCKCYDPDRTLNKSDVDSFLSESSRKVFTGRILISTTKEIGSNLRKTLEHQEKRVIVVDWEALQNSDTDWEAFRSNVSPRLSTPKHLRPHQEAALKAVVNGFKSSDRGQLIMACGTGKTLTGLRITEALNPELTVVLVPSLTLLSQILRDWLTDKKRRFQWVAVCSDDSVSKDPEDNARLIDYSFPTTTDSSEIQLFLKSEGPKVVFSTYQSSEAVAKALAKENLEVDLVLADEAHRLAGTKNNVFDVFTDQNRVRARQRLFLTATPKIYSTATKASTEASGIDLVSMDDERVFGPVFFKYSFGEAIRDKMLTDYRVVVLGVDEGSVEAMIKERSLVKIDKETTDALSLATHVAMETAMKKWNLRRVISFHSRISRARDFARVQVLVHNWLPQDLRPKRELAAETITSGEPTYIRRRALERFKSLRERESLLVTNARCLTEGVDVPNLDAIVFADPRSSKIDIIQAVGRAIRLGESDKTHGTIVIPVVVPKGAIAQVELESSNFSTIWNVLNALQSHDDSLAAEFAGLRRNLGAKKSIDNLPSKIHFDLPTSVTNEFAREIRALVVQRSSDSWEERFGELELFFKTHGHTRVKQTQGRGQERIPLGTWLAKQRSDFKKGSLDDAKANALEKFPDWTWDPIEADWRENIDALANAQAKFGNLKNIPRDYIDEYGARVGQWFTSFRSRASNGKIEPARLSEITKIFPDWNWDARSEQWEAGYEAARAWYEKNTEPPGNEVLIPGTDAKLSNWLKVNEKAYRESRVTSVVTKEHLSRLEKIRGWSERLARFEIPRQYPENTRPIQVQALEEYLKGLALYKSEYGHINHPLTVNRASFVYQGFSLGQAANRYRQAYKRGKLPQWTIDKLQALEGWTWDALDETWENHYQSLVRYSEVNKTSSVKQGLEFDGLQLGDWVARQRRVYRGERQGSLSEHQISRLEALPGWLWDASKNRSSESRLKVWNEKFELLEAYTKKNGAATPSPSYFEGEIALGRWVAQQRAIKRGVNKAGRLDPDQMTRLEGLPGWKW